MKAIAAELIDPAMFRKSVKLGMTRAIPVIIQMMMEALMVACLLQLKTSL
jgi:hypothetical protein